MTKRTVAATFSNSNLKTREKAKPKKKVKNPKGKTNSAFLVKHKEQAKLAFKELLQRPLGNLLTLAVIAMSLSLPAIMYLVGKNLTILSDSWQTPAQISIYLKPDIPEFKVLELQKKLKDWQAIENVEYISPQAGLKELSDLAGFEDALSVLDDNPLPSVLIISPTNEWQEKEKITQLISRLRMSTEADEIRLDDNWLDRLTAVQHIFSMISLTLSILMLMVLFLVVGNTLRFIISEQKNEIQVMKLVGGTDSFILRPYLYIGMWLGLFGGAFAWLLVAIITLAFNGAVDHVALLYDSHFHLVGLVWDESLLLLIISTFLGLLAARTSVLRHLKKIEPV